MKKSKRISLIGKTHLYLNVIEWEDLRLLLTVRELRLRARMRLPQIAALLKLTEDDLRRFLRKHFETAYHLGNTLTLRAECLPCEGPPFTAVVRLEAWRHVSIHATIKAYFRKRPPRNPNLGRRR